MNFTVVHFSETTAEEWDARVTSVPQASYFHSWGWIDYCGRFPGIDANLSFICLQDTSTPVAVCPLAVTHNGSETEFSFSGIPSGVPVAGDLTPSARRRILDAVFGIIHDYADRYSPKKIIMISHPLSLGYCKDGPPAFAHAFDPIRYNLLYHVSNTLITDLRLPAETLLHNTSKYQRRHIKRAIKNGLTIRVFNKECNNDLLEDFLHQFQHAHLKASGRTTRPQETWDSMLTLANRGCGSLFVAFADKTPVSYLYCGEFSSMAFGWSQANIKEYEKQYPTRHLLEWETMLYYKKKGFTYYEVGERFYGPQLFHRPTEKEISISHFKERYGGFTLPKVYWTGYFKKTDMEKEFKESAGSFIDTMRCFSLPSEDS